MAKKKKNPRYIDANLVKESLLGWETEPTDEEIEYAIDNIPTAEVEEVVRCKDCKYSRKQDRVFGITDYKCLKHNISCLSPYDFCGYGQRK